LSGWWFDIASGNMYSYERASRSFAVIDRQSAERLIARLREPDGHQRAGSISGAAIPAPLRRVAIDMQIIQAELIDQCLLSDRDRLSGSRLKLVRSGQP
jgi:hypothetical protein